MALVDTDNVSGAPRFYMAAKKLGIRPHIGAEITAEAGGRYTLLVENRTGYQNLCRLITSMKLRAEKGKAAATESEFRQYAQGTDLPRRRHPARRDFCSISTAPGTSMPRYSAI